MDAISALERSYDQLTGLVSGLGSGGLSTSTDCPGWDVRALLNHAVGAGAMFTMVNNGQTVEGDPPDIIGDDPAAAIAQIAPDNVASWRKPGALDGEKTYPFGTFPAEVGLMINLGEIVLHGWDLAQATGQKVAIEPDAATLVYEFYKNMPADLLRSGNVFGPEVHCSADASIQDRLLAFAGRTA